MDLRKAGAIDATRRVIVSMAAGCQFLDQDTDAENRNHAGLMPRSATELESSRPVIEG